MTSHLERLNPAQRAAATTPAPLLVLAGAGSGKTETLIRRVADLILGGEAAERLLCITFTAKAAGEMRSRLVALLGPERTPRWVGTFHAVMARLLVEDGAGVPDLPRGFAILGQNDARELLMQSVGIRDLKAASLLQEAVSLLKNGLATEPRRLPRSSALTRFEPEVLAQAAVVLPGYKAALAQRQALDFDDLIAVPVAAMQADPALAARWSSRWAEILVDEYQDTNHAQHALVRLLAGKPGRVFAVGDDLQAIYGWRGADVAHIRRFQKDYRAAPAPLKLETNYRSTPTILRAANAIAAEDPEALPKTLRPADPKTPLGQSITIREAPTPEDDGREALAWVQMLRRRQPELPWRECAVLVRAGFVAEPILAALRQGNVPVRLMTDREPEPPKEILATIAWLRLAMSRVTGQANGQTWNPAADDAFRRACAFPARGIGGVLFGRLREHAAERGLALAAAVATLPATPKERQGLEAVLGVAGEIADGVARRRLSPADALRLAAEASEIAERFGPDGKLGQAWGAALRAAEQAGSVAAYCDGAALGAMPGEVEAMDAVQVMTLHRAKGLEFDHVLLAGLEEGVWPHWQAEQQGAIAEERRLFYVGVTRARHSLQLSWVRHRRDWAGKPSRFLAEIPKPLIAGTAAAQDCSVRQSRQSICCTANPCREAADPGRDRPARRGVQGPPGSQGGSVRSCPAQPPAWPSPVLPNRDGQVSNAPPPPHAVGRDTECDTFSVDMDLRAAMAQSAPSQDPHPAEIRLVYKVRASYRPDRRSMMNLQGTPGGSTTMPSTRRHLAGAVAFAAVVAAGPVVVAQPAEEAAVTQAVEMLRAAMISADRSQLEALTAPQLSYGHSGGVVEDRAQFLNVVAGKQTVYKTITLSDQSVHLAGDNAIVRHIFSTDFESGGRPASSRVGVMQVWQKQDGQWRLLARQAFRI